MTLSRRGFLSGAAALLAAPRIVFARAATERRFIFIIQRGAADGLNTVIPYADPAYARLRGALAIDPASAIRLDGTFALHPALATLGQLYGAGEASFFHAVASPYRDRSHFDAQNVLETGGTAPYQVSDGWLNRLLGMLPSPETGAIAFSPNIPLALRGKAEVKSYAATALPQAGENLLRRVEQLYADDAQLHKLWSVAMDNREMASGAADGGKRQDAGALGRTAAGFLGRPDGPRIAMIETAGWDTHSGQNARLSAQLGHLDQLIAGLRAGLGAAWGQTVVLVATEFGRTAAANGTGGTDHGTGAAAMLLGGAVRGGRIIADWPGLANSALFEGRDLQPTMSLDHLIAQVCAESFQLDPSRTTRVLFPNAASSKPVEGLLKA